MSGKINEPNTPVNDLDYWDEHTDYPFQDWVSDVANNYTRAGYWEWVRIALIDAGDNHD